MNISMGPVLSFREADGADWRVSVLIVTGRANKDAPLTVSGSAEVSDPVCLTRYGNDVVLRYDIKVARHVAMKAVTYGFDAMDYEFMVPAMGSSPKVAFASCNGFSDPKVMKKVSHKNALWTRMSELHSELPYHLLIMGGDQVYADQVWMCPELQKWSDLPRDDRRAHKFTKAMKDEVTGFYFNLYKMRWAKKFENAKGEVVNSNPETAHMLASVPTLMMWDDHDIFDGWGSYAPGDQASAVYQGMFKIAKDYFTVFQQQMDPDKGDKRPGTIEGQDQFNFAVEVDDLAILALDARSERTQKQVIHPKTWDAIWRWTDNLTNASDGGPKHLLLVAPVPVVHADFGSIESLLNFFPGDQELEDDLRDHWQSGPHEKERLHLIHRLFFLMESKNIRTSILSGDVHVAGIGIIETTRTGAPGSRAQVINQLTSSAIVHPPPTALMSFVLENLASEQEPVDLNITASMINFPGKRQKFVLSRNFLSLEPDDLGRIWANWYLEEDLSSASTKVINPIT